MVEQPKDEKFYEYQYDLQSHWLRRTSAYHENGEYSSSYVSTQRYLAAIDLRFRSDYNKFKERIEDSVKVHMDMLKNYDLKGKVAPSYVTMTGFYHGLDAFAANDEKLGREYFSLIGGRHKEEKHNDSKFISSIGYVVKELATSGTCSEAKIVEMENRFKSPAWHGYFLLVKGIAIKDVSLIETGLSSVLKKHKTLCGPGRVFWNTPDEIVGFWCVGLLKLGRFNGVKCEIPKSEIIPVCLKFNDC